MNDYNLLVPSDAHMHTAAHRTMHSLLVHFITHRERILLGS